MRDLNRFLLIVLLCSLLPLLPNVMASQAVPDDRDFMPHDEPIYSQAFIDRGEAIYYLVNPSWTGNNITAGPPLSVKDIWTALVPDPAHKESLDGVDGTKMEYYALRNNSRVETRHNYTTHYYDVSYVCGSNQTPLNCSRQEAAQVWVNDYEVHIIGKPLSEIRDESEIIGTWERVKTNYKIRPGGDVLIMIIQPWTPILGRRRIDWQPELDLTGMGIGKIRNRRWAWWDTAWLNRYEHRIFNPNMSVALGANYTANTTFGFVFNGSGRTVQADLDDVQVVWEYANGSVDCVANRVNSSVINSAGLTQFNYSYTCSPDGLQIGGGWTNSTGANTSHRAWVYYNNPLAVAQNNNASLVYAYAYCDFDDGGNCSAVVRAGTEWKVSDGRLIYDGTGGSKWVTWPFRADAPRGFALFADVYTNNTNNQMNVIIHRSSSPAGYNTGYHEFLTSNSAAAAFDGLQRDAAKLVDYDTLLEAGTWYSTRTDVYANGTVSSAAYNRTSGQLVAGMTKMATDATYNTFYHAGLMSELNAAGTANAYDNIKGLKAPYNVSYDDGAVESSIASRISLEFQAPTPGNASSTGNNWTQLNYTVNSTINIHTAWVEIRYGNGTRANITAAQTDMSGGGLPSGNVSAYLNITGIADQTVEYRVWANDTSGGRNHTPPESWRVIYVESPSTAPAVTITSPLNQSYLTTTGLWANVTQSEANPGNVTAELRHPNGTTQNITMTNSTGNWNAQFTTSPGAASIRFIAVDRLGNVNGSERVYFTTTNATILNTAPANNTLTYNGQAVGFRFIPTSGLSWSNASLYLNGTRVAGITSVTNGTNNTITHTMPATNGIRTWYIQACSGVVGAGCITGATWQVNTTTKVAPTGCTGGIVNNHVLHINTTNEEDYGAIRNATIAAVLTFYDAGIAYYTNYSFINSTGNTLDVCIDNTRLGESLDADITTSSGSTWPLTSWYLRDHNTSYVTHNITVALINTSVGSLSQVYVVDKYGTQVEDWYVAVLDYDFTVGAWRQLRHAKTDYTGNLGFYLRQDNKFYSFQVYDTGMGFRFTKSNMIVGSAAVTLSEPIARQSAITQSQNIDVTCTNTTTTLTCTVTDNNDPRAFKTAHLRVWRGGALNWTISCEDSDTINPSVLECPITTDRMYWVNVYVDINPQGVGLIDFFVGATPGTRTWGDGGIVAMAFFSLAVGYIGARNIALFPIFLFIGFGIGGVLNLISPNLVTGATYSFLAIITLLVVWRLRQ